MNCKKWLGNKFINNHSLLMNVCINLKHIRFIGSKGESEIKAESRYSCVTEKDMLRLCVKIEHP